MGKAILKLIRWPNLLILILLQYFVHYYIIADFFSREGYALAISHFDFAVLVLSLVFITAAGYIINDVFDVEIDKINKKDKQIVGKKITQSFAKQMHAVLSVFGVLLAFYVSYKVGNIKLAFIYVMIAFALYYYSLRYKRKLILGNFVASLLVALTVYLVWLFDFFALQSQGQILIFNQKHLLLYLHIYAALAFSLSFLREIIKDIQDKEGDKEVDCKTIVIVWGEKTAKILAIAFALFTMFIMGYFQHILQVADKTYAFWYFMILMHPLTIYAIVKIWKAADKKDYQYISEYLKLLLVFGVFSIQLIYF
jgi:4-hydroxybenzoate polyprenyltransferase